MERVLVTLGWPEARIGAGGFLPRTISVQDIVLACLIQWSMPRGPIA